MSTLSATQKVKMAGLPGEEQMLLVIFGTKEFHVGSRPISVPGKFRVQFLLARPGRLAFDEREPTFLTNVVGDSHLGITKSLPQRTGDQDVIALTLIAHGETWKIKFNCVANDAGYIGKIWTDDVYAGDYSEAERIAFTALTPFLSAWSAVLDIPVNIESTHVTDLTTHTDMLRIRTPYVEMTPGGGVGPPLSEDFSMYASLYREGMNSLSPFYRFLCFYKIVESLYIRRGLQALEARRLGQAPRQYTEDVPLTADAVRGILFLLYPWRTDVDDLSIAQLLPNEVVGKRFKWINQRKLEPLRNGIAHGLMKSGIVQTVADRLEDLGEANRWLPLLRIWTRLLLRVEFPTEFSVLSK